AGARATQVCVAVLMSRTYVRPLTTAVVAEVPSPHQRDDPREPPGDAVTAVGEVALVLVRAAVDVLDVLDPRLGELGEHAAGDVDRGRAPARGAAGAWHRRLDVVAHAGRHLVAATADARAHGSADRARPRTALEHGGDGVRHHTRDEAAAPGVRGRDHAGLGVGEQHRYAVGDHDTQPDLARRAHHRVGLASGVRLVAGHLGDRAAVHLARHRDRGAQPAAEDAAVRVRTVPVVVDVV